MYSNRTKVYTPSKHSLDALPLSSFLDSYNSAKSAVLENYEKQFQTLLEKETRNFLDRWNANNESSYEGSLEELGLEAKVRAKLGDRPDPRSDPRVVEVFENFARDFSIPKNADWFFSQTVAKFAKLPLVKNERGYSAKRLFLDHIKGDRQLLALYFICMYQKRSTFLEKQTDIKYRSFCSLVPLIMSGFKRLNNIPYSAWDREEIHGIVEPNLANAMLVASLPEISREDVLAERETALTVKSGAKAGEVRPANSTYSLYFRADSPLAALPALARVMMCQTWCAHPSNRSDVMILNPLDWDDIPDPLVSTNVFTTSTPTNTTTDIPW